MRVIRSLFVTVLAYAIGAHAVNPDDPICTCTTCCNVANETDTHFTGKSIVQYTYPEVSYYGTYTIVGHRYDNSTDVVVDPLPYQYVVKYENSFKDAFDRNIFVFSNSGNNLNCTESHLFYGSPDDSTSKKIDFVKHETEDYCTLDINYKLSRDEIAHPDEIYLAFNQLVDENTEFNIMYDLSAEGLIVPEDDILDYPYIIEDGSVVATDINNSTEFYIDIGLDVLDISVTDGGENDGVGCLSIDELFNNSNAYWLTKTGGKCDVELISGGIGDATGDGRNYHLRIDQEDYQQCAVKDVELDGSDLVFSFRLVLPLDSTETTETTDDANCLYFGPNRNVQNITITMAQDVSSLISTNFISNFNTRIASVEPERCEDANQCPTPMAKIKFTINATFPATFGSEFQTVTLPELEGLTVEWDTVTGAKPNTIPCTEYAGEAGPEDDYKVCQFNLRTVTYEPTYLTTDDQCAFERNNTRLLTGFTVIEEMPSGQTATYSSGDLNLGLDHTEFDSSLCLPDAENAAVSVNDVFNVELAMQNFYEGFPVDWAETDNYTMNEDMIVRLSVGQVADSPFNFDDDLELMIKTVTVELSNPVTGDVITSYTWSPSDKANFMGYSWTPYNSDPRFCTWYNSGAADKCEKFFVDGTRSNTFHDTDWITNVMPYECQELGTAAGDEDTNNHDYFLFQPREWFQDNAKGLVDMKVTVTGIIHKCSDNPSRLLQAVEAGKIRGDRQLQSDVLPGRDVLYVSKDLVISFVTKENGDSHIEVSNVPQKTWFEENKTLVIVASVLGGLVLLGCFVVLLGKRKKHYGILVGSSTGPDF